jgi:hypothetical protein
MGDISVSCMHGKGQGAASRCTLMRQFFLSELLIINSCAHIAPTTRLSGEPTGGLNHMIGCGSLIYKSRCPGSFLLQALYSFS